MVVPNSTMDQRDPQIGAQIFGTRYTANSAEISSFYLVHIRGNIKFKFLINLLFAPNGYKRW